MAAEAKAVAVKVECPECTEPVHVVMLPGDGGPTAGFHRRLVATISDGRQTRKVYSAAPCVGSGMAVTP